MAAKKSKKKASLPCGGDFASGGSALGMLRNLIDEIPDDLKLELFSSMMGGPPDDFFPPGQAKPRTKAEREIESLVAQAHTQETTNAALPFLVQAEAAAKKAIGKRFEKLIGRMGEDAAGGMYLTVKVELSEALNAAGQREAALSHLEEVYRLDPADVLEARCLLLAAYLDLDRNEEAVRLLMEDAAEPWAAWLFGRVLLGFRNGLRGQPVEDLLRAAHRQNPFVLSLLLGERMPDPAPPLSLETGEDSEAQEFAASFLPAWKNTPGAISWLREAAARIGLEVGPPSDRPAPRRLSARDYARMPGHKHSTWIVGLHDTGSSQLPGEDQPLNHWLVFAFSPDNDLIGFDICCGSAPKASELWDRIVEFMLDEGELGRPAKMLVHPPELAPKLKKDAARAKIALEPLDQPGELMELLVQLSERMIGGSQSAESLDPGVIQESPLDVAEVWEAAVVELQRRLSVGGQSVRPWVALVMTRSSGVILWHELFTESPPEGALANAVRMAIARPAIGPSRRPRQVIVRDHDEAVALAALSDEAGFIRTVEAELPMIADAVASLTKEFLGGDQLVVLTKGEGTTPSDLERYYTAAAGYYRARPWKHFAMDELIGLDRSEAPGERRYALVMGQSGITMGLAIYDRFKDVEAMFNSRSDRKVFDSFSVMFGEDGSIAPADLDAIEQFGWPIATPEAYPDVLRIHPGPEVETPTGSELRFLTAAMEAIAWLTKHPGEKSTNVTILDRTLSATRLGYVGSIQE